MTTEPDWLKITCKGPFMVPAGTVAVALPENAEDGPTTVVCDMARLEEGPFLVPTKKTPDGGIFCSGQALAAARPAYN